MLNKPTQARPSRQPAISMTCAMVVLMTLAGCQKPTSDEVDAKLASIHATSTPTPIAKRIDKTEQVAYYEGRHNPFATPRVLTSAQPNLDQKPTQADDIQNKDGLASGSKGANKQQSKADTTHPKTDSTPNRPAIVGRQVHIQPHRIRQALEQYPISTLRYQGFIEQDGQMTALIMSADGLVHRVQVGQYVGQNHGQVRQVGRDAVVIAEAVMQADGRYYEQMYRLPLMY